MGHDEARRLWPAARLDDFAEFAYEPHGGFGDGHQTALAFAVAARRGGAQLRQRAPVVSVEVVAGRAIGVVLADGSRIGAAHVVLAAGPWSATLAAGVGIDLPVRAQRAQILLVDPGQPLGPLPVFSDLVSLQYVRTEGGGQILLGDSDHSDPEWADPDAYRERVNDDELALAVPKFTHRFPGFDGAGAGLVLRRLLRRHPRLQPGHLGLAGRGAVAVRRLLGPRLQDLAVGGRAHGRPDHPRREPTRRYRPARLPLGALRRGGPSGQPAPLRGRRPDALSALDHPCRARPPTAPPGLSPGA